ncbi:hypothetical protein P8796_13070, partial [Bacillus subtilis]|uniref:hypothetical protein n=1 Tax=Bacillus subtilis TaxID=1423 RepID=UPI002DBBD925
FSVLRFKILNDEREVYVFINFPKQVILFNELVKQNKFGCVLRRVSCVEHEKDTVLLSLSFILLQKNGYFKEK